MSERRWAFRLYDDDGSVVFESSWWPDDKTREELLAEMDTEALTRELGRRFGLQEPDRQRPWMVPLTAPPKGAEGDMLGELGRLIRQEFMADVARLMDRLWPKKEADREGSEQLEGGG